MPGNGLGLWRLKVVSLLIVSMLIVSGGCTETPRTEINTSAEPQVAGKVRYSSNANGQLMFTAYPESGYIFDCWDGDAKGPYSLVFINYKPNETINVTAHFKRIEPLPVTLSGWKGLKMKGLSLEIDQSYHNVEKNDFTITHITDDARRMFKNIGIELVDANTPLDAVLKITATGEALVG